MTIRGIDYIYYEVSNLVKAKEFYTNVLGMKIGTESAAGEWIEFDLGNMTLGIGSYGQSPTKGGTMAALSVDNVAAAVEELKSKGVKVTMGPEDFPVCAMAIIEDPDGNKLMLHARKDGTVG